MARRRRGRTAFSARLLVLAAVCLALWISGRAPWLSAERPSPQPNQPTQPTAPTSPDATKPTPPAADAAPSKTAPRNTTATDTTATTKPRIPTVAVDASSAWASAAACEAAIAAIVATPRTSALRVASWNLHWFPNGRGDGEVSSSGGTDVAWMACAMASLRADVIAVQEVTTAPAGRRALLTLLERLDQLTAGSWRFYLDDCADDGRQHLGFLYNTTRVHFDNPRSVAELNAYGSKCAKRLRPGVFGRVHVGSADIDLITVHLDSGSTARDYNNRLKSLRTLVHTFGGNATIPILTLGDFNTMGCTDCDPEADAIHETEQIEAILRGSPHHLVDSDSSAPNCSEHYAGQAQWLDRAVTTLPKERARFEMAGLCAELACQRPRTTSQALARLSDHCPIVIEVDLTP